MDEDYYLMPWPNHSGDEIFFIITIGCHQFAVHLLAVQKGTGKAVGRNQINGYEFARSGRKIGIFQENSATYCSNILPKASQYHPVPIYIFVQRAGWL